MNRDGHKDVAFFIGPEVEHTPAYSKRTLFVVGKQDAKDIVSNARMNNCTHIFMGANHSFTVDEDIYWDKTITELLDRGFWVTLDYQAHDHSSVLKMLNAGIWQSRIFVPLLGVRIPNLQTSSVNLTVKMDDIDFKATNPGVWCMHFNEVTDSNRFTDWQDYESDSVISSPAQKQAASIMSNLETLVEPKPTVDKQPTQEALNQSDLGLDKESTTSLKADTDDVVVAEVTSSPESTADAYADGVTADPLAADASKKPKAKK